MTTTSSPTTLNVKQAEGLTLPEPGVFDIDVSHSHVGFVVRHMMVSKVKGRFTGFEGKISVAEKPQDSTVEVTIDATTIDTHDAGRDGHLRSPDFLDVENFPTLSFRSTAVVPTGEGLFDLEGELTLHGVTKPFTLAVEQEGIVIDPYGNERIGFSGSADLNREDYGITFNMALEAGGVVVGKTIKLEIEIEAIRSKEA
jgi:polyisoprenoid-binding protein YceI